VLDAQLQHFVNGDSKVEKKSNSSKLNKFVDGAVLKNVKLP